MKKILIIGLTVLILFVVACQPTPPPPPGFSESAPIGKAVEAIGSHSIVSESVVFLITEPEDKIFLLGPSEDGTLRVETNGVGTDDFVWGGFYTCPKGCDPDDINTYTGFQVTGNFYDSYWTKGSDVFAEINIDRDSYNLGENIVIGYVCKLLERGLFSSTWDCNGDGEADDAEHPPALLADYFKLYPDCEDTDSGQKKNDKGFVTGIDSENNIYDAEPDVCLSDTRVKEFTCDLPLDASGDCISTSTCEAFISGLPGKVCTYQVGGYRVKSATPCTVASDCYYCSNNPQVSCTSNSDCQFDVFAQVNSIEQNCDPGDVCFNGACMDVPFFNQAAPSKDNPAFAQKVTAPSFIQLSTTETVELEIDVAYDTIFSTFNFGQNYDFDGTEAVSFASSTQNYGSCINMGTCQTIGGWGNLKGCGGNLIFPCQTNADCKRCSTFQIPCAQNSDCIVTSGFDGGWIMANAGKTLTFPPDNAVSDHQTALNEKGLDFGGNFLYVYGCDRSIATNSWECPYPDQNNHKWTQKVVAIIPPCIDSDGGQDQTVQGKTTGMTEDGASFIVEESAAYTDSCVSTGVGQSVVKEFYCEANNDNIVAIKSTEIACEEDETCFLGKCEVYEVPPETI